MFLLLSIKPNKFQVSCQRTDLKRQIFFSFLKKCLKCKQNCPIFLDAIYTTSKSVLEMSWLSIKTKLVSPPPPPPTLQKGK